MRSDEKHAEINKPKLCKSFVPLKVMHAAVQVHVMAGSAVKSSCCLGIYISMGFSFFKAALLQKKNNQIAPFYCLKMLLDQGVNYRT